MHHGWSGHRKLCEAWSGGDSGIAAPDVTSHSSEDGLEHVLCGDADLGCNPDKTIDKAYAIEQSYHDGSADRGAVTRRAFKGLGFDLTRVARSAASGAVSAEHDSIDRYRKRYDHDRAERTSRIHFEDTAGGGDEVDLVIDWKSPTMFEWDRDGSPAGGAGAVKYDAYGRRYQTRLRDPDGGADLVRETFHDALGNLVCDGDWEQTWAAEPGCSGGSWIDGYDPLGRPRRLWRDGSIVRNWAYCGETTTETRRIWSGTGEMEVPVVLQRDGFGRLVRVEEQIGTVPSGPLRITSYDYDALDRLIGVTMASGSQQSRSFVYDGHGNLRQANEPESQTTFYQQYDARANLLSSLDASEIRIERSYDCGGRLIEEQAFDTGPNPDLPLGRSTFSYDAGAPGRRTGSAYENHGGELVERVYEYAGRMGRLSRLTTSLLGTSFVQDQSFNDVGLLETIDYPSGADELESTRSRLSLDAGYGRGFLKTLGSTSLNLLTNIQYHPTGIAERLDYWVPPGEGAIRSERLLDDHGRVLRLFAWQSGAPTTTLFDTGVYTYDKSDNIKAMGSDAFWYFRDGSLRRATIGSGFTANYVFDGFANLTGRDGTEQWPVSPATNRITQAGYAYEADGKLAADPQRSYTWDGFDRLYQVHAGSTELSRSLYDADGLRADQETASGCVSAHRIAIRDDGGNVLSEFRLGEAPHCDDEVLWLRDNVYADGRLLSATLNGALHAPSIHPGDVCESTIQLRIGNPPENRCRTARVELFRRRSTEAYDYTAPLLSGLPEVCPSENVIVDTVPAAGTWCYEARAVHWSGNLGPTSTEVCATTGPCTNGIAVPVCWDPVEVTPGWNRRHYFADHLGTPRVTITAVGDVTDSLRLGPYGEILDPASCAQRAQFTGHEHDPESGLDYMRARSYNSAVGRFLSTDPVPGTPGNPQSWNRYNYALNNPMRFTDPYGEAAKDVADALDETVDNFVELIDDSTSEGFLGTPLNDLAVGLGFMVSGAADMFRVGDATGTVIGTGGDFHDAVMATSQDVARGSALFVSIGAIAAPFAGGGPKLGSSGGPGAGARFSEGTRAAARAESANCVFCRAETTSTRGPLQSNIDHAIARSRGGNNSLANAQNTCRTCNLQKSTSSSLVFFLRNLFR